MKRYQFIELVFEKVKLNLRAEARKTYLSFGWWFLEPILYIGVFYVVFAVFLATRTENFLVFLCCGNIPFVWFSRSVSNSAQSIVLGRSLMNQVQIPKVFFPAVVVMQDLFKALLVFAVLLLFVYFIGFTPTIAWLSLPLLILAQLVLICAVALFVSMIIPFLPDLRFIVATVLQLLMFASGIFYSYEDVILPEHRSLFLLNPVANLIRMYREVLMAGQWPDWLDLGLIILVSLLAIAVLLVVMKKLDSTYPRLVLQ